jgi:hypothetical protein
MLTKIEVRSPSGDLLSLPLDDSSGGFIVSSVEGLEPIKATVVTSSIATIDGAFLQTTRRESRNILIELDFDPDYATESVRDLRFRLYDFFMPETSVNLRFIHSVAEDFEVEINGIVESFDAPLFTDEPTATISVLCTSPDFIVLEEVEIEGETDPDPDEILIAYPGTIEAGLILTMTIDRDNIDEVDIYVRAPDGITRTFRFALNNLEDDILVLNSIPGSKALTITRAGTPFSVLYSVMQPTPWPTLWKGNNYIRVVVEGDPIPYTVVYKPKYGGL